MKEKMNQLSKEDVQLFAAMADHYQSEEERIFFETMKYKEEYELAPMHDLLLVEADNEDDLYFIRIYADEYEVGLGATKKHFQSLKEALEMRLSDIDMPAEFGTFGEWLRKRNYKGINYDGNINLH
jgi:hypothetical protein